jgi:cell division transport system ATP-binding protein
LKILHGALPLQRGQASVAGFELSKLSKRKLPRLRRSVSVVFQDFKVLPDGTVAENVALALEVKRASKLQIERRVNAVLRGLNLDHKRALKCKELSGGEQQRVAIARSMVINPQLLLADEPTGNLDDELSIRLMDIFKQFNQFGTTILLATHSKQLLSTMPGARVLSLENGLLEDDGSDEGSL